MLPDFLIPIGWTGLVLGLLITFFIVGVKMGYDIGCDDGYTAAYKVIEPPARGFLNE